ncbi:MAG TPA: discoidin domain-containing protein [Polyangiaceae bacterium]|nr:discoidin domain-containing protein [Polyangiaceae bacterium]
MNPNEVSLAGADQVEAGVLQAGGAPPAAPLARPKKRRRLLEFFWRGQELGAARAELAARSSCDRRLLEYARATAELADRTLNPVDPLRAGSGIPIAALLYREALRAGLAAQGADPASVPEDIVALRGDDLGAVRARELLLARDSLEDIAAGRDVSREDARRLQGAVRQVLAGLALPERRVRKVRLQRWLRLGLLVTLVAGLIIALVMLILIATRPPNLLEGKNWRTSSSYGGFSAAERSVDGRKAEIFFHTNEERNPWIEYDLGAKTLVSSIRVVNRGECCADRAIPLVLEASDDRVTWHQVKRRDQPFRTWSEDLSPFTARYVRLRADKQTWLHFESIALR